MHRVERLSGRAEQQIRSDGSPTARGARGAGLFHRVQPRAPGCFRLREMPCAFCLAHRGHVRHHIMASLPASFRPPCLLRLLSLLCRRHNRADYHRNHERIPPRTPMRMARWLFPIAWLLSAIAFGETESRRDDRHVVVVVWDGMRPDFISERNTPALWKL